jgi:hypothetical protein
MATKTFEEKVERMCKEKEIPGLVCVASDNEGMLYACLFQIEW